MKLWPSRHNRRVSSVTILVLVLLLPMQRTPAESHRSVQNKVLAVGIFDFSDESETNAPAELSRRLAQQLRQRLSAGFPDLLPKSLSRNTEPATIKALTVEQLVGLGKQNAAQFVIRPGVLALSSDEQSNLKAQLYAEIISVDSGRVSVVRAEGSATGNGVALGKPIQWNTVNLKGAAFASSAPGKAFTDAIGSLATAIHQAIQSPAPETAESMSAMPAEAGLTSSAENPTANAEPTATPLPADSAAADADEELQQLIGQADQLISSGAGTAGQLNAIRTAIEKLKTALANKASIVERGEKPSDADRKISANKESLQAAVASLTEQASQASPSPGDNVAPSAEKKSLLTVIDQRAGEVIGLLQKIQEMRASVRGANQESSPGNVADGAQSMPVEQATEEVAGVVTDAGQPVAGVTVMDADSEATAVTGPDGSYSLQAVPGKLSTLLVKKGGKQIATGQVDLLRGRPAVADFDIKPGTANALRIIPPTVMVAGNTKAGATGGLKGIARDKAGKPMARTLVSLDGKYSARTDSEGHYTFLKVPVGQHVLVLRKPGLRPESLKVSVAANTISQTQTALSADVPRQTRDHQRVIVHGTGSSLSGKVMDEARRPIAGAKVLLLQPAGAVSVLTSRSGEYELKDLRPGTYTVLVSRIGFDNARRSVAQKMGRTESLDVELKRNDAPYLAKAIEARNNRPAMPTEPAREAASSNRTSSSRAGALAGQVVDAASRRPIAGAIVQVQGRSVKTDPAGNYAVADLSPGNYPIKVTGAGFAGDQQSIVIRVGATSRAEFALKRINAADKQTPRAVPETKKPAPTALAVLGQVRGRVVDAVNGAPIAGATVAVSGRASIITARDGSFGLNALPPGTLQVSITRAGYVEKRSAFTIRAGELTNADFRLTSVLRKPGR